MNLMRAEKKDNGNVKKDPRARKQRKFGDRLFGAIKRLDFFDMFILPEGVVRGGVGVVQSVEKCMICLKEGIHLATFGWKDVKSQLAGWVFLEINRWCGKSIGAKNR